jgi:hypothetical protein
MIRMVAVSIEGPVAFWLFLLAAFSLGFSASALARRWRARRQCPRCDAWLMSTELPKSTVEPQSAPDR